MKPVPLPSVAGVELELQTLQLPYEALRAPDRQRDAQLVASLAEHGQQSPLGVVLNPDGLYVLIDGYRRVRALRQLARDLAEVVVVELSEADALIQSHRLDAGASRSALEDGWLLSELLERHGLGQQELAVRLDRTASWVSRRLALVTELPTDIQNAVRDGLIPAHAAQKYFVPLARANAGHASALAVNLGAPPVSVREVERLYRGYKAADAAGREQIVSYPRLFLRAEGALQEPKGSPTALFFSDIEMLSAICWRAVRRLREGQVQRDSTRMGRCMREVQDAFSALFDQYHEEKNDAQSGHENSNIAPP